MIEKRDFAISDQHSPRIGTRRNVIILTSGLTGSSVLTGLISRVGYWNGDQTHKKEYDTCENSELISLNLSLFQHRWVFGKLHHRVLRGCRLPHYFAKRHYR